MTKCVYLESDVTKASAPVLASAISLYMNWQGMEQKKFAHTFSGPYKSIMLMLDPNFTSSKMKDEDAPKLGDVIWLRAGGGQMVGFGIVKEKAEDPIHKEAVEIVFKNYNRKLKEMKLPLIGIDLYGCETGKEWVDIVDTIEDQLTDCQAVVCIPTNKLLVEVLDELPGEFAATAITADDNEE